MWICSHAQHFYLAIIYLNGLVYVSLFVSLIVNTNMLTGQDRFDDYTGQTLPGVYLLEPSEDNFSISLRRRGELHLDVTRIQFPLAPLAAGTFNNSQGKTVRNQGHTIDCTRPSYFSRDVYIQHLYMILGRAQALQYSLFRNFPTTENGDVDWSLFENGPPQYIADFLHRLEAGKSIKIRPHRFGGKGVLIGGNSYTKCSITFVNIAVAISALAGGGKNGFAPRPDPKNGFAPRPEYGGVFDIFRGFLGV